ncbi:MAG: hypothetical protein ACPGWR_04725 [Ardenticatenaceae bacterium]
MTNRPSSKGREAKSFGFWFTPILLFISLILVVIPAILSLQTSRQIGAISGQLEAILAHIQNTKITLNSTHETAQTIESKTVQLQDTLATLEGIPPQPIQAELSELTASAQTIQSSLKELQIAIDETIQVKSDDLKDQLNSLRVQLWIVFLSLGVLLIILLVISFYVWPILKKSSEFREEYNILREKYETLLGSKRLVDAELRAAREKIEKLGS